MTQLKPIERSTLADAIIDQIKQLIIDGNLKAGDRLPPERELAERLKVGRASVREALKALSSVGLLSRDREGTFVKKNIEYFKEPLTYRLIMEQVTLRELFEARRVLEGKLAELAAIRASDEDVEELARVLQEQATHSAPDDYEFYEADLAFHLTLASAARNKVLYEAMSCVRHLLIRAQEEVGRSPGAREKAYVSHKGIWEAIKEHNPDRTVALMNEHLDDVESALKSLQLI